MAEQARHTPGEWTFWSDETGAWSIQAGEGVICQRMDWNHRADESLANGRLFFAAPAMLRELQRAYSFILCNGFDAKDQKLLNDIAAVIRRAEGGS